MIFKSEIRIPQSKIVTELGFRSDTNYTGVSTTLQKSERLLEKKYKPKRTIDDLIAVVADKVGISPELICSRSRQRKPSEARAIFSYLAVEETGYPAADVARFLGVKRMSVHEAVTRGKALCDGYALLGQKRE
ncbi:MAG: hypothetical protein H8D96_01300 [Desulfobacterales bacterium]|uniref:Chromosomal replication initiator DnaA C-terminal domain-containing protein n=1 Tax=Candidatus Desulfatibia vada TaxID=2841696 RepID=A0A8J6NNL3_9BACT|nr:hypothetical protein [Candidatus Desulfatibia vada]